MGTDDPEERPIQPRRGRERRGDQPSLSDSVVSQADCANLNPTSNSRGHPSATAFAGLPASVTTNGEASINCDHQGTGLLDVAPGLDCQDTELRAETQCSPPNSVPERVIGHRRNQNSGYSAVTLPPLRSGRRRARVPGVERIGRHRPELQRENSNDSFGGNSIFPDEQPTYQQDMLLVDAHLVDEQDLDLDGPIAVAKPMTDAKETTTRHVVIIAFVLVLVTVVAIGIGIGITASTPTSGSIPNSRSDNETTVVATFVEMLPQFISPKSQAALSNPLSGPSQARLWIESLPIHNTMAIERLKQRYALATLFYSTGDQLWCNSDSWLTVSDECTWFSKSHQPVCSDGVYINLDLKDNCLQNVQLDDIFLLSSLRSLNLSGNVFTTGSFPDAIFRLTSLTALSLVSTDINGTFPEGLKDLSNLEVLEVSSNHLSGNIENIVALKRLKVFDCSSNMLNGTFPTEIGHLTNLVEWSSSSNNFQSVTTTELGATTELLTFHSRDGVSGIPSEIGNLSNLRSLDFSFCPAISGKIPTEIGRLVKLESLMLSFNQLSGTIPDEVFAMTNLKHLDLSYNILSGSLSSHVDLMVNLTYFSLESNLFGGSLPAQIGNLTSLRQLALSLNHFNGTIPSILGNLYRLLSLSLASNKFVGSIPTELGMLAELSELHLDYNNITGTIPTEFGSLSNLTFATFDSTTLADPIPSELGLLVNSLTLSLYNTAMVGPMPTEICDNVDSVLVNCNNFVACECCTDWLTSSVCKNNATSIGAARTSASSADGGSSSPAKNVTGI
jgi:Leucine-rich repeat (LRR) protein